MRGGFILKFQKIRHILEEGSERPPIYGARGLRCFTKIFILGLLVKLPLTLFTRNLRISRNPRTNHFKITNNLTYFRRSSRNVLQNCSSHGRY